MEIIRGKTSNELDLYGLKARMRDFHRVVLDLGTGDGRFVRHQAERHPAWFSIGLDSCRENLREHSRAHLPNALFVIASAHDPPPELNGLASHLTVNFPWGSLLRGLLDSDPPLMGGLASIAAPVATIEVRLNGGALAEAGTTLDAGAERICQGLSRSGWMVDLPADLDTSQLRVFPSTWARKLAHGRDPRSLLITGSVIR